MTAPRWPDVFDGLLALLPTLPDTADVSVFDEAPPTGDVSMNWVSVGYIADDGAGDFAQERDPSGFATVETGTVTCHVSFNVGEVAPGVTRARAFGYVGKWQSALEADQTLGGFLPPGSVVNLSAQVLNIENAQGTATDLLVSVAYETTTFFNP
jgi:hypothetical protein